MNTRTKSLFVNKQRLLETFKVSSSIGATENSGLSRLALTKEDKTMRDIFIQWLYEANLDVRIDDFGNIYGRREGKIKDGAPIAIGSHLDSQPTGGRFDGVLGVLGALEVIRTLNDNNIETDYPIEIINFTNEEGARFAPPMMGSGGITNTFTQDFIYNTSDTDGITFKNALQNINYLGSEINRIKQIKNFIELHIEQGPILEENDISIGIVEGVQGISWLNVVVTGKTSHAGPTPMNNRINALVPAAQMIDVTNELTKKYRGLLTTVGKIKNYPNVENIVPGKVEFKIDIRHQLDNIRQTAIEDLINQFNEIASKHKVKLTVKSDWNSPAVKFSSEVINAINGACKQLNYSTINLYSGAGHDAKYMSNITNTGMIFVKSIGGISHNEAELTADADLVKGTNVLLHVAMKLANENNKGVLINE